MQYKVHRLDVSGEDVQQQLEDFLNLIKGDIISIIPYTSPAFLWMGATSRVKYFLIAEKI